MDGIDRKIITYLYDTNIEFRRLYDEHIKFHDELAKLENLVYLTPEELTKEKELKILKLRGRDRLMEIIEMTRNSSAPEDQLQAANIH